MLKKGDRVTIYQRPYSMEDPEGEVILVKELIAETHNYGGYWRVRFLEDIEKYGKKCETYDRWVLSKWKGGK